MYNTYSQNLAQTELEKELLSLPVRQCDTLKYKQRKMDLEVKLNELDEAIKVAYHDFNVFSEFESLKQP